MSRGTAGRGLSAWRDWAAVALLVLLFLLQWARFVWSDRAFYFRDLSFFSAPLLVEVAQQWRSGHFPSWNPRVACGSPLAADPNAGVFFPDSWLLPLFGGWLEGLKLLLLFRLLAIPFAAYAALRSVKVSPPGAFLAAAAVSLSGPVATTLSSFPAHLAGTIVFLPLAAAGERLSSESKVEAGRGAFAAASLLFGLAVLSGSPDLAAQGALVFLVCASGPPLLRHLGRAALALAVGALIAAPLLLPALGLYPRTPRGLGWRLAAAPGFLSFSPARLVEFLWPGFLGDPTSTDPMAYWGQSLSDGSMPYLLSVAVGLLPWTLLPLALRHSFGRRLAITAGIFTLFSFGRYLPGSELLLRWPPFSILRYPEKWQLGATLCLAGTAGIGLEELCRALPGRLAWPRAVAFAALGASAGLAAAVALVPGRVFQAMRAAGLLDLKVPSAAEGVVRRSVEREALLGVIIAAAILAAIGLLRRARLTPLLPALLPLLLIAERLPRVVSAVPATSLGWFRAGQRGVDRVLLESRDGRFFYDREATNDVDPFRPFTGMLYGLSYAANTDVDQFSDARSRGFAEAVQRMSFADERKPALLRLTGVRVVDTSDPAAGVRPELDFFADGARGRRFYRLAGSFPARFFFRTLAFDTPSNAFGALLSPGFQIESTAVVEGSAPATSIPPGPHALGPLRWSAPDQFEIEVETAQSAWLQLAVTFDPNWRLELDGKRITPAPSDLAFLGLAVPPGRHQLRGRFSDRRFLLGGIVAVVTLVGLALSIRRNVHRRVVACNEGNRQS